MTIRSRYKQMAFRFGISGEDRPYFLKISFDTVQDYYERFVKSHLDSETSGRIVHCCANFTKDLSKAYKDAYKRGDAVEGTLRTIIDLTDAAHRELLVVTYDTLARILQSVKLGPIELMPRYDEEYAKVFHDVIMNRKWTSTLPILMDFIDATEWYERNIEIPYAIRMPFTNRYIDSVNFLFNLYILVQTGNLRTFITPPHLWHLLGLTAAETIPDVSGRVEDIVPTNTILYTLAAGLEAQRIYTSPGYTTRQRRNLNRRMKATRRQLEELKQELYSNTSENLLIKI